MARKKRTDPSGNPYVDGLIYGTQWDANILTYSFPKIKSAYGDPKNIFLDFDDDNNEWISLADASFVPFDMAMQQAAQSVLAQFAAVTNLAFYQLDGPEAANADIQFGQTDGISFGGQAAPPNHPYAGNVWLNAIMAGNSSPEDFQPGGALYLTLMHEIGHALGLAHTHLEDADGNGIDDHTLSNYPADHLSQEYSVMSYASYLGQDTETLGQFSILPGSWPQTLMMDDIAALQHMYGANYTYNSGDTVYSFDQHTHEFFVNGVGQGIPHAGKIFSTIWDGGGNDTYDFSNLNFFPMTIDLRPGHWSTIDQNALAVLKAAGADSIYAIGNVANAYLHNDDPRSLIENAIGGYWNDTIYGNQAANILDGRKGGDTLLGFEGTDVLLGGDGKDWLFGGDQDDTLVGGRHDDNLLGGNHNDRLEGGEGDDRLHGENGDDFLYGEAGADTLFGGRGKDHLDGGAESDTLEGGDDDDTLYGRDGEDDLDGGAGKDRLYGGDQADTLKGGAGNDVLRGGDGDDLLIGGGENDTLFGDTGNDHIFGNDGVDSLHGGLGNDFLSGGDGNDRLYGSSDEDTLFGDGGNDKLYGGLGNDELFGGAGIDTLYSGGGEDRLDGGANEDWIYGGGQSDTIIGGDGNDQLWGGSSWQGPVSDTFAFDDGWGFDTIHDFELQVDRIDFSGSTAVQSFSDLTILDFGNDTLVYHGGNAIILKGVEQQLLGADSFLF